MVARKCLRKSEDLTTNLEFGKGEEPLGLRGGGAKNMFVQERGIRTYGPDHRLGRAAGNWEKKGEGGSWVTATSNQGGEGEGVKRGKGTHLYPPLPKGKAGNNAVKLMSSGEGMGQAALVEG